MNLLKKWENEIKGSYFKHDGDFPPVGYPHGAIEVRDWKILFLVKQITNFAEAVECLLPLAEHHSTLCHIDDKCFEDIKKAKDLLNKFKDLK